ncbi:flagellar hook protein FlgE [Noviherbaspirillum malthae]|uniref:flagellar hook protein FlgE n=1 Tax=Noviherbaspirillum malthae TaxID=1260987 RepID=UPI001890AF28|nr:flagellar hook protein FlgE [Noviherbaspirillum malthae]
MSFQQGLSGLNAASKSLETIGNNVANANTVGFKGAQAQFADVFANALTGAGGAQVGIGTKVAAVVQQFTQGNITTTNNPLDMAINGGGFFRMSNNGAITFSRNGQFQLNKEGFIVNANGSHLTGYMADVNGVLSTGAPTDLNIRTADLSPKVTSEAKVQINLDSRMNPPKNSPFSITDPESYNNSSSIQVFDTLGNAHVLQFYYVKNVPATPPPTPTTSSWDVYASCDGILLPNSTIPPLTGGRVGTLQFSDEGDLITSTAFTTPIDLTAVAAAINAADTGNREPDVFNSAENPLTVAIDFASSTQYGSPFGVNRLVQNGFTAGRLSGFNIGSDGIITGRYTNGQSATLGQVVMANFTNPNGLQPLGNNMWAESSTSGQALVGAPDSAGLGVLQASAVEDSNVDLTAELVNMITAQRVYQANAQTIKTQDQVMQTLVNLR